MWRCESVEEIIADPLWTAESRAEQMRTGSKLFKTLSALVVFGGVALTQSASADFTNGSFELPSNGPLATGWNHVGDSSIVDTSFKSVYPDGVQGVAFSTNNGSNPLPNTTFGSTPLNAAGATVAFDLAPSNPLNNGGAFNATAISGITQSTVLLTAGRLFPSRRTSRLPLSPIPTMVSSPSKARQTHSQLCRLSSCPPRPPQRRFLLN